MGVREGHDIQDYFPGVPGHPEYFKSSGIEVRYSEYTGTSYDPYLSVTYTTVTAPTITISAATLVEQTTARLNGNVTDTGEEDPMVTVYWGDNDGGQGS